MSFEVFVNMQVIVNLKYFFENKYATKYMQHWILATV